MRQQDQSGLVWALLGTAIRLARNLGLHRDGTAFGLSPFETEMRRRVWWQLCVMDLRTAEDYGFDPSTTDWSFDTKIPLNIEDEQIHPGSTKFPEPYVGRSTGMCFSLLRYEVTSTVRRLNQVAFTKGPLRQDGSSPSPSARSMAEKERLLEVTHRRLEEEYLRFCDMNDPLQWITGTVGRLVMAKLWLAIYHPLQLQSIGHLQQRHPDADCGRRDDKGSGDASPLSPSIRDRLFVTAVEVIEYARLTATEPRVAKWSWMFQGFVPWHPLAYIASELCVRTRGALVDRAWTAIDGFFDLSDDILFPAAPRRCAKRGLLWVLLKQLVSKARRAREMDQDGAAAPYHAHSNAAPPSASAEASTGASNIDPVFSSSPASGTVTAVGTTYPELTDTFPSPNHGKHPRLSSDFSLPQPVLTEDASTLEDAQDFPFPNDPESLPPPGDSRADGLDGVATADFWKAWQDAMRDYQFDLEVPSFVVPNLSSSHDPFAFLDSLDAEGGVQMSGFGDIGHR